MLSCRPTGIHAAWQWLHNSTQKYTSNTSFEFFSVAFWCFKASLPLQPSQLGLFLIVKASNDERAALVQSAFLALSISGSGYLSESEMEPLAICTGISSCIQCILFLCLTWDLVIAFLFVYGWTDGEDSAKWRPLNNSWPAHVKEIRFWALRKKRNSLSSTNYSFFKHQCQTNISSTMEW